MKKSRLFFLIILVSSLALRASVPDSGTESLTRIRQVGPEEGWSTPVNVSGGLTFWNVEPRVTTDATGQKVYVVWTAELSGGSKLIYFNTNQSGSWGTPQNITVGDLGEHPWPKVALDVNGIPLVVFGARLAGNYEIIFRRYVNGQWSEWENASRTPTGGSQFPSILVDARNNDYYVVFQDDVDRPSEEAAYWKGYIQRKQKGSGPWNGGGIIEDASARAYAHYAAIDQNGRGYCVWDNRADVDISHVNFSQNNDISNPNGWTQQVDISGRTDAPFWGFAYPTMDVDNNGNVYVVWEDGRLGNRECFFRKRINGVWKDMENLSNGAYESEHQTVAVNRKTGDVYAAWGEERGGGNYDIYFREFTGGAWSPIVNLTKNSSYSSWPAMFVDDTGTIHMVYLDMASGKPSIYYMYKQQKAPAYPPTNLTLATNLVESGTAPTKTNSLAWANNPKNGNRVMKSYKIWRKESGQPDSAYAVIATVDGKLYAYDDAGLSTAKVYTYRLTAVSPWDEESAEPSSAVTEVVNVFPPRNLSLTTATNKYLFYREKINTLKWEKYPLNDALTVASYKIFRKKSTEADSAYQAVATVTGSALSYMDRGLSTKIKFAYRITTVDSQGRESVASSAIKEK